MDALEMLYDHYKETFSLSNTIIQTLLWLLIVYVMIRYIQDMLYVERQYIYLDSLEKEISNLGSVNIFAREGANYQKDYPMVLNFIDPNLFKFVSLRITGIKKISEFKDAISSFQGGYVLSDF